MPMDQFLERQQLRSQLQQLALRGVYVGTSSWKYPGWCGQVYERDRYVYRGAFSEKRFERLCLGEYAEVFHTVCVDAAYYKFPSAHYLEELAAAVGPEFRFGFKITDEITIKQFNNLPRFGTRAGRANPNFLNADLFASAFLQPCQAIRDKVGLLIFEFSRFYPSDFGRGRDFVAALDQFLGRLPRHWPYGVEIRNRTFLLPEYFETLARYGVVHVYNNWADMPSVAEQMTLPNSQTNPNLLGARFLLAPGRKYQDAVDLFSPYDRVQEINEEARRAGAALIDRALSPPVRAKAFVYVNNRLEGNAPQTIRAMIEYISSFRDF